MSVFHQLAWPHGKGEFSFSSKLFVFVQNFLGLDSCTVHLHYKNHCVGVPNVASAVVASNLATSKCLINRRYATVFVF